ncbi:hypothetical protein FF100_29265 [Methylobacterium terricola]|uniref:Uncharacterized protein n=1 Tax=Methylobacterium terricola TaxID=2583531 RepID=A0A5C4L8E1_9HYPH|nr:hypothetical protein [Methylobacterium terricola]TNC08432.1 hypothetical protein FF100_29265 [Methylobacterium terricola]
MVTVHGGRHTYYVVQSFSLADGGYVMDEPIEARSEEEALAVARRLAPTKVVTLAFSRAGDPETGEFDDAVLIFSNGELPEDVAMTVCA